MFIKTLGKHGLVVVVLMILGTKWGPSYDDNIIIYTVYNMVEQRTL